MRRLFRSKGAAVTTDGN
jgi:hypothetical protein